MRGVGRGLRRFATLNGDVVANDNKSSMGSLPGPGLTWVLLLVAGAFLAHEVPWQGSRPTAPGAKTYAYAAKQDVDARLWQDPLGAVARGRDDIRKRYGDERPAPATDAGKTQPPAPTERSEHAFDRLREQIAARSVHRPPALILGVMIPGAAYPESVEYRRRARYAALAGLHRMGFTPDDAQHLGYVLPPPAARLPDFIAFEWMVAKDDNGPAVLTLWLDENVFGEQAACRLFVLRELLEGRTSACPAAPAEPAPPAYGHPFVVVGPSFTSTLQDLLQTTVAAQHTTDGRLPTLHAYGATADDAALMKSIGSERPASAFHDILANRKLDLLRTIGVDSALGGALKTELIRRGVDPAAHANCDGNADASARVEHVILISERDSLYGRSLPDVMSRAFAGAGCDPARLRYVHRFTYLRGLDGQLASVGSDTAAAKPVTKSGGAGSDRGGSDKLIERPEGEGQLDYLRRLSIELTRLDDDLRRRGDGAVKTVGVLGSDVYDKLLILQALRPQLQNVIFFTTDLDARLLHPQEQDWARNLIVASNFGLQLNARLQDEILPFRDGYQTSVYLSTQVALHNALAGCAGAGGVDCIGQDRLDRWLGTPRVFEVGRLGAFDFSARDAAGCERGRDVAGCEGIHPAGSPRYPPVSDVVFRDAVLLAVLGVLLFALARGFGTQVRRWMRARAWLPLALAAVTLTGIVLFAFFGRSIWLAVADRLTEHGNGEPISLTQGVSIWPSEAIRVLSIGLSLGFLYWAWRLLDRNLHEIAAELRFEPTQVKMERQVRAEYRKWSWWQRLVRCFSFRLVEYAGGPPIPAAGLDWSAQVFWQKYLYQGRFLARCLRVSAATGIYLVVGTAVVLYFGAPNTPFRGDLSRSWNQVILPISVCLMLFVIFFVVDATVFCHQIVKALQDDVVCETEQRTSWHRSGKVESLWAASTLAWYHEKFGITGRHLDAWILMDFITRRTDVVAKLIYFPFIVISLMVLSRSPFFDNWTMPLGLIVVLGSSVLIVSGCAILLRRSAEEARQKVLKMLSDDLIRLKGDEGRTGQQIEAMIAQVRALHEGAFAPFSQQPFFRALLLPLSTFGGSALLDWLTAASF